MVQASPGEAHGKTEAKLELAGPQSGQTVPPGGQRACQDSPPAPEADRGGTTAPAQWLPVRLRQAEAPKAGEGGARGGGPRPSFPPLGSSNRTASCPGAPRGDPGTPLSLLDLQAWGQGRRCPRHLDVWSVLPASVTSPVCLPPRASRHQSSGLTSCSERPSMISDTSCSLRAADMDSPLPRWPTLLETRGTQLGPSPRQPGCRPAPRPTPEAAASPDVACGRRGGAGAPVPQGQPQPGVQGRTWAPDPGSAAPEPSFLSNKAQPHRSTSRPQSCLCGPAPQFPSVTWR